MAAGASSGPAVTNGIHESTKPIELSINLPGNPGTKIHLHLTILATSLMLFLTSSSLDSAQGGAAMGSFVYAMPDVRSEDVSIWRRSAADSVVSGFIHHNL